MVVKNKNKMKGVSGMVCSGCGGTQSTVYSSRPRQNTVSRRRECQSCGHRWTTWEFVDDSMADSVQFFRTIRRDLAELDQKLIKAIAAYDLADPKRSGAKKYPG